VGIRGTSFPPMNLPNVPLNVIAHELGHAIGLGHNSDPTTLMCGRPAPCRPNLFRSDRPRMFPLTDDEKRQLLTMYPPQWKPQSDTRRYGPSQISVASLPQCAVGGRSGSRAALEAASGRGGFTPEAVLRDGGRRDRVGPIPAIGPLSEAREIGVVFDVRL
jgi:hypothetical protein